MVAEILNRCDHKTGESILQFLEETDAELAEKVRKMMFVFEDLLHTNDMGIRELLKEIKSEVLSLALKTASEDLKAKIFKNLSQRAAQMVEEDISMMAPARLSEVEAAQQEILTAARRLEKEGNSFWQAKRAETHLSNLLKKNLEPEIAVFGFPLIEEDHSDGDNNGAGSIQRKNKSLNHKSVPKNSTAESCSNSNAAPSRLKGTLTARDSHREKRTDLTMGKNPSRWSNLSSSALRKIWKPCRQRYFRIIGIG